MYLKNFTVDAEKRNIQSLKNSINGGRKKRELSESELEDLSGEDEYADPLVQTAPVDYEELYDIVNQAYPLQIHSDDKRFLGEFKHQTTALNLCMLCNVLS